MQPFQRHPASSAELTGLGSQLRVAATQASEHTALTRHAYQPAISGWSGVGAQQLRGAPEPLARDAGEAGRAIAWAGLVAEYWAGEVGSFNRTVDHLLATVGSDQYWGATGVGDEPPSEAAILSARHLARLRWHRVHETHILDGSDRVAAMLRDGPTDTHLAELAAVGLLPGSTAAGADWYALALLGGGLATPPPGVYDPAVLLARLELLRSLGVPPSEYAELLQLYWVAVAAERAGIDLARWDPSRGADQLSDIIPAVYRYYGDLYLEHPHLQWAGMANLIGPSFAAGFFDLSTIRTIANRLGPLAPVLPLDISTLDNLPASEIRFFETTFLQMHQDIFFDQAMMHEAYLNGGLPAIAELREAGLIDSDTERAWQQIDAGHRTLEAMPSSPPNGLGAAAARFWEQAVAAAQIEAGNTHLLLREQRDIIDDYYQQMYDRPVTGPPFTYLLGAVGEPSIPGAQTFAEYSPMEVPVRVSVETPSVRIPFTDIGIGSVDIASVEAGSVQTPFPDGNLADFEDRWGFIRDDTLPAYQQLLREDPDLARELMAVDPADRIDEFRLHNRLDSILGQLTNWDYDAYLDVQLGPIGGRIG